MLYVLLESPQYFRAVVDFQDPVNFLCLLGVDPIGFEYDSDYVIPRISVNKLRNRVFQSLMLFETMRFLKDFAFNVLRNCVSEFDVVRDYAVSEIFHRTPDTEIYRSGEENRTPGESQQEFQSA